MLAPLEAPPLTGLAVAEMFKILLQIASFSSAYLDMLPQNTQFSQRILNISARH